MSDIFVHDRQTGETTRVSVSSAGAQGTDGLSCAFIPGTSTSPSISPDGRFVVFDSRAPNLVAGDTNAVRDIFLHDRTTGATSRVSLDSAGGEADGGCFTPQLSADGAFVVFGSVATNLVFGDTNGARDVFLRDLLAGTTIRVSVASGAGESNGISNVGGISADGRFIAFDSMATNLVSGDTNAAFDVFVHHWQSATTVRISENGAGAEGDGASLARTMTSDGSLVAVESGATNFVAGDANLSWDIFVAQNPLSVPPSGGTVNDGTGADIDSQTDVTTLSANWAGFILGAGPIASFEWAIGTSPGAQDVQAFTNVGAATNATNDALTLSPGQSYFASVRAIDTFGNLGPPSVSDGVSIPVSAQSGRGGRGGGRRCFIFGASSPLSSGSFCFAVLLVSLCAVWVRQTSVPGP